MIRSYLRWQDVHPADLRGHCAVVIDVLRWSSVVITALANGAEWVEAHATPEDALARAEALGRSAVVLGGERGNVALPGFDLGNSPLEYSRARVAGRGVVTTTTNGTQGLVAARDASLVLIGAFVNLHALAEAITGALDDGLPVALIACGQAGEIAEEDAACAGAIAMAVGANASDVATGRACAEWARAGRDAAQVMARATHAASLRTAGFGEDVDFAARVGSHGVVPRLSGPNRLLAQQQGARRPSKPT